LRKLHGELRWAAERAARLTSMAQTESSGNSKKSLLEREAIARSNFEMMRLSIFVAHATI
jgi:hypothetical protein